MNEITLTEMAISQADALNRGENIEARLLAEYRELDPDDLATAASIFELAKALKEALTPVAPATAFKRQLRDDLVRRKTGEIVIRPPAYRLGIAWRWVAGVGSFVSIFGVAVLLIRRLRTGGQQGSQPATSL